MIRLFYFKFSDVKFDFRSWDAYIGIHYQW